MDPARMHPAPMDESDLRTSMLHVIQTIIPIFAIIAMGWLLREKAFLPDHLVGPLNRLVYYLAIPAMIFREVAEAPFAAHFRPLLIAGTLVPLLVVFALAYGTARWLHVSRSHSGTFLQSAFHGNLGYIGLAVCFYFLGDEGFTRASVLAGFLMLLQNFLAVVGLQLYSRNPGDGHRIGFSLKKIVGNPVIISALAGLAFSFWRIPVPETIDRILMIISGMALPLALLVIGASLSFPLIRSHFQLAVGAGILKLLILPAVGFFLYAVFSIPEAHLVPGMILLAAPTATITYVMAGEMKGSTDLASAAITLNTLLSAVTYIFWLSLLA
jgi:predicted permease